MTRPFLFIFSTVALCALTFSNASAQRHQKQNNRTNSQKDVYKQKLLEKFDTDGDGELSKEERAQIVQARAQAKARARNQRQQTAQRQGTPQMFFFPQPVSFVPQFAGQGFGQAGFSGQRGGGQRGGGQRGGGQRGGGCQRGGGQRGGGGRGR